MSSSKTVRTYYISIPYYEDRFTNMSTESIGWIRQNALKFHLFVDIQCKTYYIVCVFHCEVEFDIFCACPFIDVSQYNTGDTFDYLCESMKRLF